MRGLSWFVGFLLVSCQTTTRQQVSAIPETTDVSKQSVVFITGHDEGENRYYTNARKHFQQQGMRLVAKVSTLEGVIHWLNANHNYKPYDEVHIVSHGNPWRGMSLRVKKEGDRVTASSLKETKLPKVEQGIDTQTKIVFHSCGLGSNVALMKQLKQAFTSTEAPTIYSSAYFNVFGGKYASHYLAETYYAFYPTAQSQGPLHMAAQFDVKYPEVDIDWLATIKRREEGKLGEPYSYKFNIPVSWTFQFEEESDMPTLETTDHIVDLVLEDEAATTALFELGIPLEDFRWRVKQKGNTLTIEGKTTALCILVPMMHRDGPWALAFPRIENKALYQRL